MRSKKAEEPETGTASDTASRISAEEKAIILKQIADKLAGTLRAEDVVRESDPANPAGIAHRISDLVGWAVDNDSAAFRWRQDQARAVIRSVRPILIQLGVVEIAAPYYVHDPSKGPQQGYVPVLSFKTEEQVAEDAIRAEFDRAAASLERAYGMALALEREEDAAMALGALSMMGRAPQAQAAGDGVEPSLGSRIRESEAGA